MKSVSFSCFLIFLSVPLRSQTPDEILIKVFAAQGAIKTMSYDAVRMDTLTTGSTRVFTGKAKMTTLPGDTIMGFAYWGKVDKVDQESIYDGHFAIHINHKSRAYLMTDEAKGVRNYVNKPSGHLILKDFVRLDTSRVTSFKFEHSDEFDILTMFIPDQDGISNFHRVVYINRQSYLPMRVVSHLVYMDKGQTSDYKITRLDINDSSQAYDFSKERYPADYKNASIASVDTRPNKLINKPLPFFELKSFSNVDVSSASFANKVVLLDFWEVWCTPCISSMPKVDSLYEKYKSQGLEVYGMMNEPQHLETARSLVYKKKIRFPMLVSNNKIKSVFGVNGVPTYILINRKGKITYISEGFSQAIDDEIRKALYERL